MQDGLKLLGFALFFSSISPALKVSSGNTSWSDAQRTMEYNRIRMTFILICVLFLCPTVAQSAPLAIKRLTLEQGLSQSTVYAIVQDRAGYIWFGTADGIDIYDGHAFRHLRHDPDNPQSLSGNYVKALLVSRDGNVWIGTLGGGLNLYNPTTQTLRVYRKGNGPHNLLSDDIHCLYEAIDGALWVGSEAGVSRYTSEGDVFTPYSHQPNNPSSLPGGVIRTITQSRDGRMWFGSATHGLSALDPSSGVFVPYRHQGNDANSLSDDAINAIHQDQSGLLWVATESGGLNKLDLESGAFTRYQQQAGKQDGLNDTEVTSIFEDGEGMLWLGTTSGGLNRFDPRTQKFANYRTSQSNPDSLSSDTVISLFADRSGMLWAGTFDNGVNRIAFQGSDFDRYSFDPLQKNGLVAKMIWSFAEDQADRLWVGTNKGLSRFDPQAETFASYLAAGQCVGATASVDVRSLVADGDRLWLGTAGDGLIHFNPTTCAIRSYQHDAHDPASLSNNHVRLLLKDQQHRLWIGTNDGLNVLSSDRKTIKRYLADPKERRALPHSRIRALYEGDDGNLWIGTSGGLSRYDNTTDSFETITAEQGLLSDNDVRSVYQDAAGILWIATGGGLTRYDPQQQTARFFHEKDGLANDTLYGLLSEGDFLWITTNIGLSRLDRRDFSCKNFNVSDGLQSNEFNFNAYAKTRNGALYVGGVNGFNRFTPQNLGANITPPQLQVEMAWSDQGQGPRLLSGSTGAMPLQLKAFDHRVTFTATVLHYLNPQKNTYQYRLKGFDPNWIAGQAVDKKIVYSGLPPGDYLFQIRAFSSNGIPGAEVINQALSVKPPLTQTTLAYLLYACFFVAILFGAIHLRTVALRQRARLLEKSVENKTLELHHKNKTLEMQRQQLSTLLQNQDDFYLRTAHELRTPLSLIRIPVEHLALHDQTVDNERSLGIILRATARLQRLLDQMLQAAIHGYTHEAGVQTIDLQAVMAPLFGVYRDLAEQNKIVFILNPLPVAAITINRRAIEDIIHNLLDNALKYTPEGGQISVELTLVAEESAYLLLSVNDNGIGIDGDSQAKIFDRLYRSEQARQYHPRGEGVGLHIVKQHVDACGGSLELASVPGQGSAFRVGLPCQWTFDSTEPLPNQAPGAVVAVARNHARPPCSKGGPSVLIIEDDEDMQQLLKTLLEGIYQLNVTGNAAQGLLQARKLLPDLVVCDVMLPDGSGFDIIHALKSNEETKHIPLILLTAVGDLMSRTTGWKKGADDYIVKPFSPDDLLMRIAGLLANRKRLQAWYNRRFLHDQYQHQNGDNDNDENNSELAYLANLETQALILLDNGNCCLDKLAAAMGQGGRTLQRRLKSLLDCSYTEYLQSVQLKKARKLLLSGRSVKEAAYAAGFHDPAYFSKIFRSFSGVSPSRYRQTLTPDGIAASDE
ncbi:MAG: response regulator [Desulfobulbaceae bacterium]|nr:response regulator [Desulfobulbaceae bacterium]